MSLDYDLGKINNYKELCYKDGFMTPRTQQIIFGCISTGIGEITEKNYIEWFMRYSMWCGLHSFDNSPTLDDVRAHIGLRTNVFPQESRTKWVKRHMDGQERDIKYVLRREEAA
jgi:hypothetical protein